MAGGGSSAGSSAGVSTSSSRESAVNHLNKRAKAKGGEDDVGDLLEDKKSINDLCFMCINTLAAEKAFTADWRINLSKIVLEGLTGFLVVFNPLVQGWDIDYNVWFWQIISWSTYHSAVAVSRDYNVFTNVMYLHVAVVAILLAGLLVLALTVNKVQKSRKLQKWVKVLHFCMDVVFNVGFMTIFSVFTFMFNCDFESNNNGGTNMHLHYRDVDCSQVPHLAHMVVGGIFGLILGVMACIMVVADTEHSPLSRAWLASPSMVTRMKIVVAKMVIIVCAVGINQPRRAPTIMVWLASLYTWWLYFRQMPFYNTWVNISISSMWLGIAYTASLLMVLSWGHRYGDPDFHYWMTWNVLKGVFPVMAGGACCHYAFIRYKMYWTRKFIDPSPTVPLRKIFKFEYPEDVEIMSRSMRKFDRDGTVDLQAVQLGDTILQAGMQYFPKSPTLVIQYAALLLEARHEGALTRTQLQNAMKHRLGVLDKYRIFVITQRAKRMKNAADGTMDLQSYVEFKRNYRMLARVHKEALQHLRDFWKLFMRSKTQDATVKQALKSLTESSTHAQMVYTKFMERYPNNGKVLKCYGKFLEEVKNDIAGAAKYYSEGNRLGSTDAIMNMDFDLASKKKNDFLVSMDMHEDAVIIIDAVGTILMISQGLTAMFGYTKIELENANVNMLMPQPFSQRHPSYLQRYTSTGDPHIIDKVQEVVALHKDKFVFPTELGVTQLSGTGSDCVFLGVMKKMPMSIDNVRVWVAPNGVVLCADQQFSGLMGYPSEALVGMSIYTLLENPAAGEAFTEQCKSAVPEDFAEHRIKTTARFVGKYLPPVPCSITVKLGGTQTERIFVWNVKRTDRNDEMTMVCDTHGTITFATWDVAALLGTNTRKLVGTKLDTLLPPPYNSMHAKWLQETPPIIPPSSCRAGVVVNLLNSSHVLVPVRIKVHQIEDQGLTLHVVRLTRAAPEALVEEKRVSLTCNLRGTIEEIEPSVSRLFGWPALEMKGRHIADVVDTFATWRQRIADRYHGGDLELCMADASSGGTKLLLLALMDQEYARPGGSYRVSVKPPDTDFATAIAAAQITQHQGATLHELLHNAANAAKIRAARPAVMQPEVVEVNGVPAVKVHLFKQESLTGYLEMDPSLNIRKADMWAALVLGWPTAMLTSQKLHNLLQVPPNCGWEELMGIKAQMGGLKRVNRGTVTAPRKFVASHPDGGTMRITIQGVSKSEGLGSKNRIEATLHADTAFKGEPSTIFEILELEDSQGNANALSISESREEGNARRAGEAERNSRGTSLMDKAGGDSGGGGGGRRVSSSSGTGNAFTNRMKLEKSGSGRALLGVDEGDEGEEEELHKRESGGSSNEGGSLGEEAAMNGSMGSGEDEEGGREDGGDGLPGQPVPRISAMGAMMQGSDDEDEEGEEEAKKSENKPGDFVAQWVRTVANQGERPETPNSNAGDSEVGDDKHTTSRARPALMAIDEDNEDMVGGEEEFQQSRHLTEMRGSPLGSKRRTSGTGGGFGTRAEEGEEHPDARASVDLPPPGQDWEREVADMPDEAAEIALAKKAKGGKRPGNKLQAAGGDQPSQPGDDGHSESSAGDGGTETDGQSVNSSNSAHDEILIDFRRGRLLKKLIKLVRGPSLMEPLERLDVGTLRVLAAVLAVHIVCFAVIMVLFAEKAENMTVIKRHALTIQSFERMRFRAVQAKFCTSDVVGVGLSFPDDNMCELARDPSKMQTTLLDAVDGFSMDHHDTYLGLDGNVAKLKSPQARALWDDAAVDAMMYYDTIPPEVKGVKMGIWEFGNRMAYATREIAVSIRKGLLDISDSAAYQFVAQSENKGGTLFAAYLESLRHLAMFTSQDTDEAGQGVIAILVVQAIVVLTLLHMYQLKLVVDVERARLGNILALVGLPGPILRIMHAKPVNILDDDSDDEADEEETGDKKLARAERKEEERKCQEEELRQQQQEAKAELEGADADNTDADKDGDDGDEKAGKNQFGGMAISGPSQKSAHGMGLETTPVRRFLQLQKVLFFNGKALTTSWERTLKLVLPLFLWQLAVLIVFAMTNTQVGQLKDPLASLFMQMRVNAWFGHVRSHALKLVADPGPNKALWREMLQESATTLESNYEVLLYGNGGQISHDFPFAVPPAAFASTEFSGLYFREKMCFREEAGQCLGEQHRFYEAAHNGLDALMRRFIMEAKLLSMDDEQDATFLSPRFDFIHQLGMFDLAEGLTVAADVFTDFAIAKLKAIQEIHIVLLVVTLVLAVGYVFWVTKPYVAGIKREAAYVAGLLSHCPKELDVTNHLKGALKV